MAISISPPDKKPVELLAQGTVLTLSVDIAPPLEVTSTVQVQISSSKGVPLSSQSSLEFLLPVDQPAAQHTLEYADSPPGLTFKAIANLQKKVHATVVVHTTQLPPAFYQLQVLQVRRTEELAPATIKIFEFQVQGNQGPLPVTVTNSLDVRKDRAAVDWTPDAVLSVIIKRSLRGLEFSEYTKYIDLLLCNNPAILDGNDPVGRLFKDKDWGLTHRRFLPFNDTDAYRLLKAATEAFVVVKSAVFQDELSDSKLPAEIERTAREISARGLPDNPVKVFTDQYLQTFQSTKGGPISDVIPYLALIAERLGEHRVKYSIFPAVANLIGEDQKGDIAESVGLLRRKLTSPIFLELIWSYWHEQGTQAVTMYAIRNRFQNRRTGPAPDPLAAMEFGVLRPLNNLMWGYIQDEQHRLTPMRRGYEYDHHYGLRLPGAAATAMQTVDSRSRFLEAWHNLLFVCTQFYREDDDTNRKADAFRVLNAIKEVHFLLSEGASLSVWRPAHHIAYRNADGAVAARQARDARIPAYARIRGLSRRLDGCGGFNEDAAGLDVNLRDVLP